MGDPVKQTETPRKVHPIGWDLEDWLRIGEAAKVMSARAHLDLGPTHVIRSGTRRFCDELLGPVEEPARAERGSK